MTDNKMVTIYVNTVAHQVPHQRISYETLIGLASPGATGTLSDTDQTLQP
jgi:hypothetical protein